jgi:hypothetical protein
MVGKTFSAHVTGGQLCHQEPLDRFEGQDVYVTVVPRSSLSTPLPPPAGSSSDEPPAWMAVETDLYVKMPFPGEVLRDAVVVEGTGIRPCLILPEDLPDE